MWKSSAWSSSDFWIVLFWSVSKAGLSWSLSAYSRWELLSVLAVSPCLWHLEAAWFPSTVLPPFCFLPLLYSLVYLFSLVICAFFQDHFLIFSPSLTILSALQIMSFCYKTRAGSVPTRQGREHVVTANICSHLVKHSQNKWGMFMLWESFLETEGEIFAVHCLVCSQQL